MKKKLLAACLIGLLCGTVYAKDGAMVGTASLARTKMFTMTNSGATRQTYTQMVRDERYKNYTFYWSCDSLSTANKAAGNSTIYASANITIDTDVKAVGTGSVTFTSNANQYFYFKELDNLDRYNFRIGYFILMHTIPSSPTLFSIQQTDTIGTWLYLQVWGNTSSSYDMYSYFRGTFSNGCKPSAGWAADTWYFMEYSVKNAVLNIYIDGVLKKTYSGTRDYPYFGNVLFERNDANAQGANIHFDNIIVSTNPDEDLYAIRNNTSF